MLETCLFRLCKREASMVCTLAQSSAAAAEVGTKGQEQFMWQRPVLFESEKFTFVRSFRCSTRSMG